MPRFGSRFAPAWFALAVVCLLGFASLAAPGAVRAHGTPATAFGLRDGGYRYQIVGFGEGAGFEAPAFDDSAWAVGAAGFGSQTQTPAGICAWNNPIDVRTVWPERSDLLVRKTFELPAGAHNLRVVGTVDNDAAVYVNGISIGSVTSGFCRSPSISVAVPDGALVAGTNVLAIRASDYGAPSFLDVQVTYDGGPAYGVCPLHDQSKAHKAGATAPLKLMLCDGAGANLSDPAVVVHATGIYKSDNSVSATVVEDTGNANPDQDFRYDGDLGGYIYNLKTTGLTSGTWVVTFTVNGEVDPSYYVTFDVK